MLRGSVAHSRTRFGFASMERRYHSTMALEARHWQSSMGDRSTYLIVGGGINGAVSAAVLAGRGANVALVDRGDFGSFTSQASSNLVWGGFKYLEGYEILLVRKLCVSRNRLIKAYPDNIKQIAVPRHAGRTSPHPTWLAALGATGYWGIGGFRTHRPRYLRPKVSRNSKPWCAPTDVDRWHRVLRRLPAGQRLTVRVRFRAVRDRRRGDGRQLCRSR